MSTKPKKRKHDVPHIVVEVPGFVGGTYAVSLYAGDCVAPLQGNDDVNEWATIGRARRVARRWGKWLGLEVREAK